VFIFNSAFFRGSDVLAPRAAEEHQASFAKALDRDNFFRQNSLHVQD
jgi:hypothetical protein